MSDCLMLDSLNFFFLMIRRPPRSTLFPYNDALPICPAGTPSQRRIPAIPLTGFLPLARTQEAVCRGSYRSRSEEHTSELQSQSNLVCRLLLEKNNYSDLCIHDEVPLDSVITSHMLTE